VHAGGAQLGFHRRVFDDVGGFDARFRVLEDTEWCVRAHLKGYEIVFVPEAVYHYRFRADPESIRRQAYNYAVYRSLLRKLYGGRSPRGLRAAIAWTSALSHAAWLMVDERFGRLRADHDPVAVCRRAWRFGEVNGDLAGARAHDTVPTYRGFGTLPRRLNRTARSARLAVAGLFRPTLFAVRTDVKALALTFDDGPDPATTPVLLDLLARLDAKATFFLVGTRAQRYPELVARIAAEGHEIGNHSWDHPSLPSLSETEVADQLIRTREALQGHGRTLMRPPFGDSTHTPSAVSRRLGYEMVIWSVNGEDWFDDDANTIARRILDRAHPGTIVLLHDSLYHYHAEAYRDRTPTFAAVEQVVRALSDWRFVTVSELQALGRPRTGGWHKTTPRSFLKGLRCAEPGDASRQQGPAAWARMSHRHLGAT
jgi:peptidoglycan/xylan/chitin deacetylase (PgdA/CDA1 family)